MPARQQLTATPTIDPLPIEPVRKSVRVRADPARAFHVFTAEMDSWWPRSHHIGSSPMKRVVVEPKPGGAIYTDQEDGTACPWGSVLTWDPPHRFVMAWRIRPDWTYEDDLSRSSEVELRFTPADDGTTLVELEHRALERHGSGGATMREQVNAEGGWGALLSLFATRADQNG